MRINLSTSYYILLFAIILQGCSKSAEKTNTGTTGTGTSKYVVDTYSGATIQNSIQGPTELCVDSKGFLYVAETNHNCILKVDPIAHLAGPFSGSFNQPGCMDDPFGSGNPSLTFPSNLWIDDDIIYIGDYGCGTPKTCTTTGSLNAIDFLNPNNIGGAANGVCVDYRGNIYLFDTYNGMFIIRAADHILAQIGINTKFGIISSMTMDADDKNVYISAGHKIWEISSDGTTSVIAGSDSLGNKDGAGSSATFGGAMVICTDPDGNIYVADINNNTIREVSASGLVTTIAGDGKQGYKDGTGTNAEFFAPSGIAFTTSGDNNVLYVSDYSNNVIRRITFPKQ
jgi:NHL repeat-containing protein